ncbi:hypothetical protein [Magnetospirillum sp. SS-4]|uniref:hypothetical protein n=1 Tax=Magnetospirillum sp. SS-4 TaxID=2681465 RepID=UPI00137FDF34|nr:hypothetical protein [Magnetospirillum sp. SS-4]CAA7615957.1 conserved exported hypothetical protein [Magnetospirillum sp. SS-4]
MVFRCRIRDVLLLPLLLLAAVPAVAADMGGRLVAGGASSGVAAAPSPALAGETRSPLLVGGGFSVGAVASPMATATTLALPFSSGTGNLAVGGYVAYGFAETSLSSSFRRSGSTSRADISAAYAGSLLGVDGVAALRLGAAWTGTQGFSPNPLQPGAALADPYPGDSGFNLSFSLMHQVTPAFSLGGVAEASRPAWLDSGNSSGFMLGAGMGYRF